MTHSNETRRKNLPKRIKMAQEVLSIPTSLSESQIESYFSLFQTNHKIALSLPVRITFGGNNKLEFLLNQLIITWAQNTVSPTLVLHVSKDETNKKSYYESICKRFYYLTAITMSDKLLANDRKTRIYKNEILEPAVETIKRSQILDFEGSKASDSIYFLAIAKSINTAFPRPMYRLPEKGAYASQLEFELLTRKSIDYLLKQKTSVEEIEVISSCIFELWQNTDEHGLTDSQGNPLKNSTRGIVFKRKSTYNTHLNQCNVTVCVFDSGIGISRRFLKKSDCTHEEEINGILKSFEKGATSKSSRGAGFGLARVKTWAEKAGASLELRDGSSSGSLNALEGNFDFTKITKSAGVMFMLNFPVRKSI